MEIGIRHSSESQNATQLLLQIIPDKYQRHEDFEAKVRLATFLSHKEFKLYSHT